jgi:hypothetical protein
MGFTGEQKRNCLTIFHGLLNHYRDEGDSFETCHWGKHVDPPSCSTKQMPEHGMEKSNITSQKKFKNSTIGGRSDVDAFLGYRRVNFEILPREGHNSKTVSIIVKCLGTS